MTGVRRQMPHHLFGNYQHADRDVNDPFNRARGHTRAPEPGSFTSHSISRHTRLSHCGRHKTPPQFTRSAHRASRWGFCWLYASFRRRQSRSGCSLTVSVESSEGVEDRGGARAASIALALAPRSTPCSWSSPRARSPGQARHLRSRETSLSDLCANEVPHALAR
jgi:hypothetical protein